MYKPDDPSAVAGAYIDGVPGGAHGTAIRADHLNAITMELVNAIQQYGIVLNKADSTQLADALVLAVAQIATVVAGRIVAAHGIDATATNTNGDGVKGKGGAPDGYGVRGEGSGNGRGVQGKALGSGPAVFADASAGSGPAVSGTGNASASAVDFTGGAGQLAIKAKGGSAQYAAEFTGGSGSAGLSAVGGSGDTDGAQVLGKGTGAGIRAKGGNTPNVGIPDPGVGGSFEGGSDGDGLYTVAGGGNRNGAYCIGKGTGCGVRAVGGGGGTGATPCYAVQVQGGTGDGSGIIVTPTAAGLGIKIDVPGSGPGVRIAGSTGAALVLIAQASVTEGSQENGAIWFDGSAFKCRIGNITRTLNTTPPSP